MKDGYLPARLLQLVGLVILIAAAVFWAVTGRESPLFISAAMSLILLGAYRGAIDALRKRDVPPTPPPATIDTEQSRQP